MNTWRGVIFSDRKVPNSTHWPGREIVYCVTFLYIAHNQSHRMSIGLNTNEEQQ